MFDRLIQMIGSAIEVLGKILIVLMICVPQGSQKRWEIQFHSYGMFLS